MTPRQALGALGLLTALTASIGTAEAVPAPPSLPELVQAVDLSGLSLSPDGMLAAFRTDSPSLERNSYDLAWHVVDLCSGTVTQISGGGAPIVEDPGLLVAGAPVWSPDGRWLYYRALREGEVQIWRSAADGSATERVTAEAGDVLSLATAGGGLVYSVGPPREEIERAERVEYESGILVDEHVELGQNLFRGALIHGRPATQRLTGQWFARGGILWRRAPIERRLDFATHAVADVARAENQASRGTAAGALATAISARGDVAEASWSDGRGRLVVRRANASGAATECAAAPCRERIVWLAWRAGREQLLFAAADRAHVQTLHLWDPVSGEVRRVAGGEGLLNGGRNAAAPCAVATDVAICVDAGPAAPPRLERIDLESGERRPLFDPNAALRARSWPAIERLEWRSAEGRLFTGLLFAPHGASRGRRPMFVNYYRCEGFVRGGVGDEWPFAALAAEGIVSVCVNATRTSGPQDAVAQYRWALGGIRSLIELLDERGMIDRTRVGMGGLSFGSEVTMWTVMHSGLIAAASVASPQFEPANYWFNNIGGRDHDELLRRVWGLGSPDETPGRWRLISPALNVARIRAPLLLQLPEQEARYAVELYARLTRSATPAEMYVFPEERHIKFQPRHRLAAYRRNLDWFRFWLQGREDPDPARAGQYRRWRALAARAAQPARERSQSSSAARSNNR